MKTLAFYSLLMCLLNFNVQGQGPEEPTMENSKSPFDLNSEKESLEFREKNPNEWSFTIKEKYVGEFIDNPADFVVQNFKIEDFLSSLNQLDHEFYDVNFKCKKGYLEARYSRSGELVEIFQKFEDVALPRELMHQLYRDYKGWKMITNKSVATFKEDGSNRTIYRIQLRNGDRKKLVKIPSEPFQFPGSEKLKS